YPPVAFAVAEKTVAEPGARGILLCGSGVGVSIAANKVCGARAVLAHTRGQAALARAHDDVNILCLRADDAILADLHATVDAFLRTPFDARERRVRRLRQIATYEKSNYCPDE
ncbi:MAG TPA: RpiB/LacA/LacB family sugar-phosphate isomerase, partial [Candidatus Moranbacteria bacterium]|nr:RpiB/LacA/LacB family sugar-phosphate isomerase [Candidatus Moranbacteria bacterium]